MVADGATRAGGVQEQDSAGGDSVGKYGPLPKRGGVVQGHRAGRGDV